VQKGVRWGKKGTVSVKKRHAAQEERYFRRGRRGLFSDQNTDPGRNKCLKQQGVWSQWFSPWTGVRSHKGDISMSRSGSFNFVLVSVLWRSSSEVCVPTLLIRVRGYAAGMLTSAFSGGRIPWELTSQAGLDFNNCWSATSDLLTSCWPCILLHRGSSAWS
jgi:hypothetical protein